MTTAAADDTRADAVEAPTPRGVVEAPRPASRARIEANRRNALRSTGPKTDEGKRRARANAIKHGLTALKARLGDDDDTKIARRRDALIEKLGAEGDDSATLFCEQAAHASIQLERAGVMVGLAMRNASLRAESVEAWAADRWADVEKAAATLSTRPSAALSKLADTPQGIDWLVDRWKMLRFDARPGSGWTEACVALAMDLLAIPVDFRWLGVVKAFNEVTKPDVEASTDVEVCDRMIRALNRSRETSVEVDEIRRESTVLELSDEHAPEVRRLARYEAALHRRFRWSIELAERFAAAPRSQPESEIAADAEVDAASATATAVEPAATQNEPNADSSAEQNEANLADPPPSVDEPASVPPTQPTPGPNRKHRPDPARLLRQAKQRRQAA